MDFYTANVFTPLRGYKYPPEHTNRDITIYIYLNNVWEGGSTVFFRTEGDWCWDRERRVKEKGYEDSEDVVYKVLPEVGKAVIFFPTIQPRSGVMPDIWNAGHKSAWKLQ